MKPRRLQSDTILSMLTASVIGAEPYSVRARRGCKMREMGT
jgi:hypothetical protein